MYCRICNREFDGEGNVCPKCRREGADIGSTQAQNEAGHTVVDGEVVDTYDGVPSTKAGFKRALASTIMSTIDIVIAVLAYVFAVGAVTMKYGSQFDSDVRVLAVVFRCLGAFSVLLAIVLGIISLVMGIRSIKTFIAVKRTGAKKPVATLVLGIVGTASSGFALLYALIAFIMVLIP